MKPLHATASVPQHPPAPTYLTPPPHRSPPPPSSISEWDHTKCPKSPLGPSAGAAQQWLRSAVPQPGQFEHRPTSSMQTAHPDDSLAIPPEAAECRTPSRISEVLLSTENTLCPVKAHLIWQAFKLLQIEFPQQDLQPLLLLLRKHFWNHSVASNIQTNHACYCSRQ